MLPKRLTEGLKDETKVILNLLALGLSSQQISDYMGVGNLTTLTRLARLRQYTGMPNSPALVRWALDNYHIGPLRITRPLGLTPRQAEIVEWVALGFNHREIGTKLYISAPVVKQRVQCAMDNAGALNRTNLVALVWSEDCYEEFPLNP